MIARRALVAGLAVGAAGCSVLLDWNDFSGGTGDGGVDAGEAGLVDTALTDTSADVPVEEPTACGTGMACAPSPPAGWTGPLALYTGTPSQGQAPPCGSGFDPTPVFDGNGTLNAPPATCSACSCGAPSGGTCSGPVMSLFFDTSCQVPAAPESSLTLSTSCMTTALAESVSVAAAVPSGGTCSAAGGTATTTPTSWGTVARACGSSATSEGSCGTGEVCAPASSSPFGAGSCVLQAGVATTCPAGYPSGPQLFYTGVDDQRACGACQCGAPSTGTCSSPSVDISTSPACSGGTTLTVPSGCSVLSSPPAFAALTGAPTLTDAGTCAPSGGAPGGAATGTGVTSFCCTP